MLIYFLIFILFCSNKGSVSHKNVYVIFLTNSFPDVHIYIFTLQFLSESEVLLKWMGNHLMNRKRETIVFFFVTFGLSYERQGSYWCAHSFISTCFSLNSILPPFCFGFFTFLFLYFFVRCGYFANQIVKVEISLVLIINDQ